MLAQLDAHDAGPADAAVDQQAADVPEPDDVHLQQMLEEAGFTKEDLDYVNDWQLNMGHVDKFRRLLGVERRLLRFHLSVALPQLGYDDAGLVVHCAELGQYIVGLVKADDADDALDLGQLDEAQARLRQAMLDCVKKDDFNETQQRNNVDEAVKLTWA